MNKKRFRFNPKEKDDFKKKNGKKGASKQENGRVGDSRAPRHTKGVQFNDISYYTKNPSIVEAFAKLPFNHIVGNAMAGINGTMAIPAIFSFVVDWVLSSKSDLSDASSNRNKSILDEVATIIYTTMRRHNSGATNSIEYLDVLVSNLLASIDIYVNAHYLHRMFKIANTFSWKNRLIPRDILSKHLSLDYEDFIENQANYRGRYNHLVAEARTIRTLANFPFLNAIMDEFNNIFKDTDTDTGREQLIITAKAVHHIYNPVGTTEHPGGMVRLMTVKDIYPSSESDNIVYTRSADCQKFSVFLDILEAQIKALINDSDFNLIQADIEKAFGDQSGYIVMDVVDSDTTITPIYSGEFLTMFHNGIIYPDPVGKSYNTTYRVGTLESKRYIHTVCQIHDNLGNTRLGYYHFISLNGVPDYCEYDAPNISRPLDTESNSPDVNEIVLMTRYRTALKRVRDNWNIIPADVRPEEDSNVFSIDAGSNFICFDGLVTVAFTNSERAYMEERGWNSCTATLEVMSLLKCIEKAPIMVIQNYDAPGMEINNMRGITADELRPIQDAVFLSLWDLPERTSL